jgi:5'-methylthioadenosine phosphorylase
MTNMPEAKLAREAELCYATLALVTDYDCWHEAEADVTADAIVALLKRNVALAQQIVQETVLTLPVERRCSCKDALREAIITSPEAIPAKLKEDLQVILRKYLA